MGKGALVQRWLRKSLAHAVVGELVGVLLDPLQGHRLNFLQVIVGVMHAAIALYLTHLLTHSRTEQRLLIGEGDAHQVAFLRRRHHAT